MVCLAKGAHYELRSRHCAHDSDKTVSSIDDVSDHNGAVQCISKCAEKYLKHASRIGVRYAELQTDAEEEMRKQMAAPAK